MKEIENLSCELQHKVILVSETKCNQATFAKNNRFRIYL